MTLTHLAAAIGLISVPALAAASDPGFDRSAWKADFERVKVGLAQGYANLDWQVDRRTFNLARADAQIGAMLDKAQSDVEAALVFAKLIDAFDDPHLQATGGLADITLPDGERAGQTAQITLMPLRMDGQRLDVRRDPPRLGQHTAELLQGLGYTVDEVASLQAAGAIA